MYENDIDFLEEHFLFYLTKPCTVLSHTKVFLFCCSLIEFNHGNVPITFKQFESVVSRLDSPEDCVAVVDKDLFGSCVTPVEENHDELYGVPAYEALVLDEEERKRGEWIGGETEALRRLQLLEKEVRTVYYH